MLNFLMIATTSFALGAFPKSTTTPEISGKYAIGILEICQAVEATKKPGLINSLVWNVVFDQSTGVAHVSSSRTDGKLVVWSGKAGMSRDSEAEKGGYSNTATTFTFKGVVFDVVYGPVKGGVAQSFMFSGIGPEGAGCAATATAIKQ